MILIIAIIATITTITTIGLHNNKPSINNDSAAPKNNNQLNKGEDLNLYLVELEKNLNGSEVSEIRQIVRWAGELHNSLLPARMEAGQIEALEKLPFVKKVYIYPVERKVSGELLLTPSGETNTGKSGKTEPIELLEAVVTLVDESDKQNTVRLVESLGGTVTSGAGEPGRYLRIKIPREALVPLTASTNVLYMEQYNQPELLNDRVRDIVAARPLSISSFITDTALNGRGQTIGLADSGLDTGSMGNLHPDLESPPGYKPKVIMLKSWAGVETPADTVGHGTHMAGTMVGSGQASGGNYAGLAPEASLYFQGIVDEEDNLAPPLDLETLLQPAYEAGVRIHVNGWGRKRNTYNSSSAQIDNFVFNHPGFLAVFAAGNSGSQVGSLTSEANSKNALTVGASLNPRPVFDNVIGDTTSVAGFSSRGPAEDGRIKPELVAPGTNIISAASQVVKNSLPGRPEYTSMQGTSMASAVTGSAAALLRQYLQENVGIKDPSAALLKAALINGAQRLEGTTEAVGFGLLDIGSTVIALENQLFDLEDNAAGISAGESITHEKIVTHSGAPFKATLTWTDPAAVPGSRLTLVNDLDLEVIAPDGAKYYGNDFDYQGLRDGRNNVEQVYIPDPEPGTYKIIVRGKSIMEDTSRSQGITQDYALVFGRSPARDVVSENTGDNILLAGGDQLAKPKRLASMVNDELRLGEKVPPLGAELYLTGAPDDPQQAYAIVRTERVNGAKALEMNNTTVLVRVNSEYREGGHAIDSRAREPLILNGRPVDSGQTIPPGVSLSSYVNPRSQTIWQAEITSREASGIYASYDTESRQIKLIDHEIAYSLAEQASVSFTDIVIDGDPAELPFGASTDAELDNLLPGMPLNIALGSDEKVYNLSVKRYMVTGKVTGPEPGQETLALSSGSEYRIIKGLKITRDGAPAGLEDIKEGDLAMLDLIPDSAQALGLTVYSDVIHGRVIYTESDTLYLMANNEGFDMLRFHPEIRVFRWGMSSGTSILNPGQWVRVIRDPVSGQAWRVDIADYAGKTEAVLDSFYSGTNMVKTADGDVYRLSSASKITKNQIPVPAKDLISGEPVTITSLYSPDGDKIVVALDAKTRRGVEPPELKVSSTLPFEDFSLVTGTTTVTRLYAWYRDGTFEEISVGDDGSFYYPVMAAKAGNIQLVAVHDTSGGVAGLNLNIPRPEKSFPDIEEHWAGVDIRHLVSRGMLSGYRDGNFQPDKTITRLEFTVMLARLLGAAGSITEPPYKDVDKIPDWAKSPVALAHHRGLAQGYEDNTFRPDALITREEAASLLVRAYDILQGIQQDPPGESPLYADQEAISDWARDSVQKARQMGMFTGRSENHFTPKANITRAETAAALNRLLSTLTDEE